VLLQAIALAWLGGASIAALGWPAVLTVATAGLAWTFGQKCPGPLRFLLAALLVAIAFGGTRWYIDRRPSANPNDVSHFIGDGPTRITGRVVGDPEERQTATLARLAVTSVLDDRGPHPASGLLLLRLSSSTNYEADDQIDVRGKPVAPKDLGGFDYRDYLARQGIFAELDYPSTQLIGRAPPGAWRGALLGVPLLPARLRAALSSATSSPCVQSATRLRACLVDALKSVLPEPEATVGADIAFGTRGVFAPKYETALARTETAPIVVATGYNVTILAVFGLAAFSWLLGRRWALVVTLVLLAGYSAFIGLTPSVLRAALMGAIVVGAGLAGRPHSGLRALILAAAVMVLVSPLALDDLSFPLSLTSTAGLFLFAEPLGSVLRSLLRVPTNATGVRAICGSAVESIALTTSASVASIPILLVALGKISPSTLPANLILFPMVPWVMAVSGMTAVAGMVARPLAVVTAPPAYAVLHAMMLVIQVCALLPGDIPVGTAGIVLVSAAGFLVLVLSDINPAGGLLRRSLRTGWQRLEWPVAPERWWTRRSEVVHDATEHLGERLSLGLPGVAVLALTLGTVAGLLVSATRDTAAPAARITYLDVGSGSAILVESGSSRILVDGGPAGGGTLRALDALLKPWDRSLNLIVVANASPEHVGGLTDVLAHYRVGAVADAAPLPASPLAEQDLIKTVASNQVQELPRGAMVVRAGAATIKVQPPEGTLGRRSPSSATVELTLGARRFLLAGDAQGLLPADVRDFSSVTETLPATPARIEVLEAGAASAAASDLAGVPEGLRSALLYRTTENGTITIETDGTRVAIQVDHGPRFGLFSRIP